MISFGILVHNETESFKELLDSIISAKKNYEYEIVVIYDPSTDDLAIHVESILIEYKDHIKVFRRALNNDFASQKNFMTEKCSGDYIVNIDADELLSQYILENVEVIAQQSELIGLPRVNTVEGLTQEWSQRFGFRVNDRGWINFPDTQWRIYKNDYPRIKWHNKVHENILGHTSFANLSIDPEHVEHFAILHPKSLDRQIIQNEKYAKIIMDATIKTKPKKL